MVLKTLFIFICLCALLSFGVIGYYKIIEINELKNQSNYYCISGCLQDYEEYGTINFFSISAYKSYNLECIDGNILKEKIKNICCIKRN